MQHEASDLNQDEVPDHSSDGTDYHPFSFSPLKSTASVDAIAPSIKSNNLTTINEHSAVSLDDTAHYRRDTPNPVNSTTSIDAIAPTKSFESFAPLQSLFDSGDIYVATYSHWSWEREDELAIYCTTCRRERCAMCHGQVFTEVAELGEKLTSENGTVKFCTPCEHGLCSGRRLRLATKGGDCGHAIDDG